MAPFNDLVIWMPSRKRQSRLFPSDTFVRGRLTDCGRPRSLNKLIYKAVFFLKISELVPTPKREGEKCRHYQSLIMLKYLDAKDTVSCNLAWPARIGLDVDIIQRARHGLLLQP